MKRCTKCGENKPPEAFHRNRSERDGVARWCRDCMSSAASSWYRASPDARVKNRQRRREQRAAHPDEERERRHTWRADHPEEAEANRVRLRQEHKANREAVFGHYGRACACCGSADRLTG